MHVSDILRRNERVPQKDLGHLVTILVNAINCCSSSCGVGPCATGGGGVEELLKNDIRRTAKFEIWL